MPSIDLFGLKSRRWQDWFAFLGSDAQDQVATAPVVEIIRKGADRLHDFLGVPAFLEFDALPFDRVAVEEFVDDDGKCHRQKSNATSIQIQSFTQDKPLLPAQRDNYERDFRWPCFRGRFVESFWPE